MNKSDIYVGTIKRCIDIENYKKFGEEYSIPEVKISSMELGILMPTIDIVSEGVVLVKTSKGYIKLRDIYGLFVDNRLDKGKIKRVLPIEPVENFDLYVDEESLKPYYTEALEEKIKVKNLKDEVLYDCRIKCGIEY